MASSNSIQIHPLPLDKEREEWVMRGWNAIDESRLAKLNRLMASIPSPTGEEKQLAQAVVDVMSKSGMDAFYQPMDDA